MRWILVVEWATGIGLDLEGLKTRTDEGRIYSDQLLMVSSGIAGIAG